jgi:hypothetical protein
LRPEEDMVDEVKGYKREGERERKEAPAIDAHQTLDITGEK